MYNLIQRKLKEVDEYYAAEILEFNTYEGQRKFNQQHCNDICGYIESGNFLTGDVAIAHLTYDDNRKVMVNGQHQCKAVIKTGIPIVAVYQEYSCPTPGDLSLLYRFFDNHRARSLNDIISPEAAALGVEWKRAVVRLVVSAAALITGIGHRNKIEKVKLLAGFLRQGAFINHIMNGGITCFHMNRAPVAQAMMMTWDKDKEAARKFWESVRDGVGLSKDSPALVLRNYLLTAGLTKSRTTRTNVSTTLEMHVKCIHAWNAYRRGTRTELKYHADAPVPKII